MSDPLLDTPEAAASSPTLAYDNFSPAKDPNARRVLPAYWLGTILAGILYAGICTPIDLWRQPGAGIGPWIMGTALPIGFAFVFLLSDTLFLGITLWIRSKLLRYSRLATFRTAFLTGFVAGLYPAAILQTLDVTESTSLKLFFCELGWHILFPVAAAFWLCHRSHLRETPAAPSK